MKIVNAVKIKGNNHRTTANVAQFVVVGVGVLLASAGGRRAATLLGGIPLLGGGVPRAAIRGVGPRRRLGGGGRLTQTTHLNVGGQQVAGVHALQRLHHRQAVLGHGGGSGIRYNIIGISGFYIVHNGGAVIAKGQVSIGVSTIEKDRG